MTPRWTPFALAGIVLGGALLLWTQAAQVHLWAPDEEYFVQLSRLLSEHFPSAVVDLPVQDFDQRGIQRLTILLLALPLGVVGGETGIELGRAVLCVAFTSAAIPAYLLARGARLSAAWGLVAAALVALVPWTVLTGAFLSESVAYPTALWALWAAWRACVKPGLGSDLIAIGFVVLAGLARTNLLVLIVVAPIAVTLHTLASVGWRRLPGQMWRDHPLFAILIPPGAIIVLLTLVGIKPGPVGSLAGNYVVSLDLLDFGPVPEKFAGQVSRMVTGLGVVPLLIGLPWMLRQAFRRTSPEEGALAIAGIVGFVVVLFSTVYAAAEERYLMLAATFVLVPSVVAIARRETPAWAIALTGVVLGALLWRVPWPYTTDPAFFLSDPSQAFVGRVIVRRMPADDPLWMGVLVLVLALAIAAVFGRRGTRAAPAWAAVAVVAVTGVIQLVQTGYVVTKHTDFATGPGKLADWTWVDDAVGRGEKVGIHAVGIGGNPGVYDLFWRDLNFFNRRSDIMMSDQPIGLQIPRYGAVTTYRVLPDGRIDGQGGPMPRYLLQPTLFRPQGVLADPVETSTYLPVELVRFRGAPRVTYDWTGGEADGWLSRENPRARVEFRPPALETADGDVCAGLRITGPPERTPGRARYRVTGAGVDESGTLGAAETGWVEVPLRTGREELRVRASEFPREYQDGRTLAIRVGETRLGRCGQVTG